MTDHAAFLAAVIAAPDDDGPRLAFADALELGDAGFPADPARAEFIRVQVELAKLPAAPTVTATSHSPLVEALVPQVGVIAEQIVDDMYPGRAALRKRERELLDRYSTAWLPTACDYLYLRHDTSQPPNTPLPLWTYTRGFVSQIVATWEKWQRNAVAILAACPIRNARDGVVRLTTWPPAVQRGEAGYSLIVSGTPESGRERGIVRDDGDARAACLELLAAEWRGVRFDLPTHGPSDLQAAWPDFSMLQIVREQTNRGLADRTDLRREAEIFWRHIDRTS